MTQLSVSQATATEPFATTTPAKKTAAVSPQTFMEELSKTLSEARSKLSVEPNNAKAAVGTRSCQTNVTGQNSVAASSAVASAIGFNALVPKATSTATPAAPPTPSASDTIESADDAYWAQQPAAVQQLRNIDDYSQRSELAAQLASEGYSIDTPVMVWGWDPSKTTQLRQSFGYTWVPSAMQSPVTAAPGISGGGIIPYNPDNPPAGSIKV